jgi:hypothetical protein
MEALVSQVAEATTLSRVDVAAFATIESEDDLRAILRAYQAAGQPLDVSTFDRLMGALTVASTAANLILPVLGIFPAVRAAFGN